MWDWFRFGKRSRILPTAQQWPRTARPNDRHEPSSVFIYTYTFLAVSQLADITEHADGDRYI